MPPGIQELTDAELEALAAGKDGPPPGGYNRAGRVGLIVTRALNPGAGAFAGFSGFGNSLGSIGRGFALAARR